MEELCEENSKNLNVYSRYGGVNGPHDQSQYTGLDDNYDSFWMIHKNSYVKWKQPCIVFECQSFN